MTATGFRPVADDPPHPDWLVQAHNGGAIFLCYARDLRPVDKVHLWWRPCGVARSQMGDL